MRALLYATLLGGLLAGCGPEQDEEAASKGTRAPVVVASAKSLRTTHVAASRVVPLPAARPKTIELVAAAKPAQRTITVASLGSNLFDKRGYWRGAVEADPNVTAAATMIACQPQK